MTQSSDSPPAAADFVIVGAGAIGSIIGAHLARAGHSVVMLVRERRARQIQADGLRISGLANFATPVAVLTDPSALRRAGTLIVGMKTPGTDQVLWSLSHVDIGVALSIQNGPIKNELLTQAFGPQRVLGALADTSGEMSADGEVNFTRNVNILLGELSAPASDRVRELAHAIDSSGVRAAAVDDIQSLEWSKFAAWIGLMALSVTTRAVTWKYLTDPDSALLAVRMVREMGSLVRALGIELSDQSVLPSATICNGTQEAALAAMIDVGRRFETQAPQHRMSSLQDLLAGRPLELHETLGYALEKARAHRIEMPMVETFYHLIQAIARIGSL